MQRLPLVSISIVSHLQGGLIRPLLEQMAAWHGAQFELLLTINVPEDESFIRVPPNVSLHVFRNLVPRGFGANHNRAFEGAQGDYYLVLNPDIRAETLDFRPLIGALAVKNCGVVGPCILDTAGRRTDSPRRFPTTMMMLRRLVSGAKSPEYGELQIASDVEWVGGMFMLFPSSVYRQLGGFDERFFMYMEDVDICRRLGEIGMKVCFLPGVGVIHDARRQNRNSLRHMRWHVRSLMRYLFLFGLSTRWPLASR